MAEENHETKLKLLFKLFVRSYLQRKNGLYQTIKRLESYYNKYDDLEDEDDIQADEFSTMVTQSIMDVHETSMKNDELLVDFIELIQKYESDEDLEQEISDTIFDIDDNIENEDDFDQDKIKEVLKNVR